MLDPMSAIPVAELRRIASEAINARIAATVQNTRTAIINAANSGKFEFKLQLEGGDGLFDEAIINAIEASFPGIEMVVDNNLLCRFLW
jgi:hypothetical protein